VGVVDPSGIQISVVVKTARGTEFPLWMGGARSGEGGTGESLFLDANVGFQDLPIVSSVNIEMMMSYMATCTVELSAPYDLGLALLDSELFIVGNVIIVQVGYPRIGLFLPKLACMAIKPSITINPDDGLTATINGRAGCFASTRGRTSRVWENTSVVKVAQELANLPHNRWDVTFPQRLRSASTIEEVAAIAEAEGVEAAQAAATTVDPLYGKRPRISQPNRTDWDQFTHMCRVAGCRAMVRPQTQGDGRAQILVERESDVATREPVYTLTSRGQIDMISPNGRFPLLSFESEAENLWLSAGSDRVVSDDIDSATGDPVSAEANQDTVEDETPNAVTETGGTGNQDTPEENLALRADAADGGDQRVAAPANSLERTPGEAVGQVAREEGERGGGVHATVSTIGNPVAFPNDRIRIENLGPFSGNYEIEGMSHQVAEGEWTTTMRLIRRGTFGDNWIAEIIRRQTDNPQDQEPEDQPEIGQDAQSGGAVTAEAFDPFSVEGI